MYTRLKFGINLLLEEESSQETTTNFGGFLTWICWYIKLFDYDENSNT